MTRLAIYRSHIFAKVVEVARGYIGSPTNGEPSCVRDMICGIDSGESFPVIVANTHLN